MRIRARWCGLSRVLVLVALSGFFACDQVTPSDPAVPDVPGPSLYRIDATTGEGDPHFYFMPPLFKQLFPYRGVFEGDALEDLYARRHPKFGGEMPIRLSRRGEFYETHLENPSSSDFPCVHLAEAELGCMGGLRAAETPDEVRHVRAEGNVPFTPGRPLRIRFRVEVGAGEGHFNSAPLRDGRARNGDPRLLFVPPSSGRRATSGPFDPDLAKELAVEVWTYRNRRPHRLVKRFAADGQTPRQRVRVNHQREFYTAIWSTADAKPWLEHRARVFLRGLELGWVLIDVVPLDMRGPSWPYELGFLQKARRAGMYAVLVGSEASIRFRMEKGEGAYDLTVLSPLSGHDAGRGAQAINDAGQVVGTSCSDQECRAVVWDGGEPEALTPGRSSRGHGINDLGVAVGSANPPEGEEYAFVWRDGAATRLPGLIENPTPNGPHSIDAYDINGKGVVVGRADDESGTHQPVVWRNGSIVPLEVIGEGGGGNAVAINDGGVVVGFSYPAGVTGGGGVVWKDGTLARLEGTSTDALAINEHDVIAGRDAGNPVVWVDGRRMELPLPIGLEGGVATGINDHGVVVGYGIGDEFRKFPVIWANGDVTRLPVPVDFSTGEALDINNAGVIVGEVSISPDRGSPSSVVWRKR